MNHQPMADGPTLISNPAVNLLNHCFIYFYAILFLIIPVFLSVGLFWFLAEGACPCTGVEISICTGLRRLTKAYVWPLGFLADGPDCLPKFPK